jgi:membrane peptidoglycan carboxypeptidase
MSIGYEIGVTALQTASAFAIIANNGVRVSPHIIKEIRQADGKIFSTTEAQKTEVVSSETARQLRQMLQKVVLKGTGKRAALNGYTSAGKTGTAWKFDPKLKKVSSDKYVSSFVGMAPVDDPAVVIAVVLDEPRGAARNGGDVSAPIFREIAEQILPDLNVAPDGGKLDQNEAGDIPSEMDQKTASTKKSDGKTLETIGKNPIDKPEKVKESDRKKESPDAPKKESVKSKTTAVVSNKPKSETKNKSSTERTKSKI